MKTLDSANEVKCPRSSKERDVGCLRHTAGMLSNIMRYPPHMIPQRTPCRHDGGMQILLYSMTSILVQEGCHVSTQTWHLALAYDSTRLPFVVSM